MLCTTADTFAQEFHSLSRSSPSMRTESERKLTEASVAHMMFLRSHTLWLLSSLQRPLLREVLACVDSKVQALTLKAHARLDRQQPPKGAPLQHSIPGARHGLAASSAAGSGDGASGRLPSGRLRKKTSSADKERSPAHQTEPPTKTPRHTATRSSLEEMYARHSCHSSGSHAHGDSESSPELAIQKLAALLPQMTPRVNEADGQVAKLQEELREATLRADRAEQRATAAEGQVTTLQTQLDAALLEQSALRSQLGSAAASAGSVAPSDAASALSSIKSAEVVRLEETIYFLKEQNSALLLLISGKYQEMSTKLEQLAKPPAETTSRT